jgi:hypothetical protein
MVLGHYERLVASVLDQHRDDVSASTSRPSRMLRLVLAAVCVVSLGAWWLAGGTFIGARGARVGTVVRIGEDASFGFPLSADGGGAWLQSVTGQVTPDATVEWSVYQGTGSLGFGTWHGPLAPTWAVRPVDGAHVNPNKARGTWVIATVRSSTPGVYRVSHVSVTYQSGWRTRLEGSSFVGCVLVVPANTSMDELSASNDPLWQEYKACPTGG